MDNVAKVPADGVLCENTNVKDVKGMPVEPLQNFKELLLQGDKTKTLG